MLKLKHHTGLSPERWYKFTLFEQLANIGSDVIRAMRWKERGNQEYAWSAFERSLELFALTILDPKNKGRLHEVFRTRENWIDFFAYDNQYRATAQNFQNYFDQFAYAAAIQKGK